MLNFAFLIRQSAFKEFYPQFVFAAKHPLTYIRPLHNSHSEAFGLSKPSSEFALTDEWNDRIRSINDDLNISGDYEWISTVQKKFSGGGKARYSFVCAYFSIYVNLARSMSMLL